MSRSGRSLHNRIDKRGLPALQPEVAAVEDPASLHLDEKHAGVEARVIGQVGGHPESTLLKAAPARPGA